MADPSPKTMRAPTSPTGEVQLTQAEFDALVDELHELRDRHRLDFARRLREAREHGSPADNDDVAAVLEEVSLDVARIARLEQLLRDAQIVDAANDGVARVGCTVEVTDLDGRQTLEYRLVGHRGEDAVRRDVTPGSPVGAALIGAHAGDVIRVELPNGRGRRYRVLRISPTARERDAGSAG
jgi:transcription elongation factor GreA